MRIRWTPEAVDNLDTICSYIAEDSPEAALIEKLTGPWAFRLPAMGFCPRFGTRESQKRTE